MEPCIGGDPFCPCQDGDACHYKDYPRLPGHLPTKGMRIPTIEEREALHALYDETVRIGRLNAP
jgi:hypothetical protein